MLHIAVSLYNVAAPMCCVVVENSWNMMYVEISVKGVEDHWTRGTCGANHQM